MTTPLTSELIKDAFNAAQMVQKAEAAYEAAWRRAFPVGSHVQWYHGQYLREARVIEQLYSQLRVRSLRSDKVYDISPWCPLSLYEGKKS